MATVCPNDSFRCHAVHGVAVCPFCGWQEEGKSDPAKPMSATGARRRRKGPLPAPALDPPELDFRDVPLADTSMQTCVVRDGERHDTELEAVGELPEWLTVSSVKGGRLVVLVDASRCSDAPVSFEYTIHLTTTDGRGATLPVRGAFVGPIPQAISLAPHIATPIPHSTVAPGQSGQPNRVVVFVVLVTLALGGAIWYGARKREDAPRIASSVSPSGGRPSASDAATGKSPAVPPSTSKKTPESRPRNVSDQSSPATPQNSAADPDALRLEAQARRDSEREAAKLREDNEKLQAQLADAKQRVENERAERERLENERLENERLEHERLENERLEKERLEKERLGKARADKERADKERADKESADKVRADKERADKERTDKERADKERADKERTDRERADKERADKERAERERMLGLRAIEERAAASRFFSSVAGRWKRRGEVELTETPPPRSLRRRRVTEEELNISNDCSGTLRRVVKVEVRDFTGWAKDSEEPTSVLSFRCDASGRLSGEISGAIALGQDSTLTFARNTFRR
jgi:hypothetical protein